MADHTNFQSTVPNTDDLENCVRGISHGDLKKVVLDFTETHPEFDQAIRERVSALPTVAQRKLFVRSLSPAATTQHIYDTFNVYGPIEEAVVVVDKQTQRSKQYAFVVFRDMDSVGRALAASPVTIMGRMSQVTMAITKHPDTTFAEPSARLQPTNEYPSSIANQFQANHFSPQSRYQQPQTFQQLPIQYSNSDHTPLYMQSHRGAHSSQPIPPNRQHYQPPQHSHLPVSSYTQYSQPQDYPYYQPASLSTFSGPPHHYASAPESSNSYRTQRPGPDFGGSSYDFGGSGDASVSSAGDMTSHGGIYSGAAGPGGSNIDAVPLR